MKHAQWNVKGPEFLALHKRFDEMNDAVVAAFGKAARKGIEEANDLGDLDTADLFTEVSRGIDKWLWFVEAHAQSSK